MTFLNAAYLVIGVIITVPIAVSYWNHGRFPWGVLIGAGLYLGWILLLIAWRALRMLSR